ncbi:hypothetical protein ACI2OX_02045 [Bacillus sp. N9]
MLVERYGTDTLDTMIADKIVKFEAKRKTYRFQKELDDEFADYMESYGGKEAFNPYWNKVESMRIGLEMI